MKRISEKGHSISTKRKIECPFEQLNYHQIMRSHLYLFGYIEKGNFEIRVGQYGDINVKEGTPVVFAESLITDISNVNIQIPCYKAETQIGTLEINSAMIEKTKYLQCGIPITGTNDCVFYCWAGICLPPRRDFGNQPMDLQLPKQFLIGHRGSGNNLVSTEFMENSMPGFFNAQKNNVDVIEFDIQFSKDKIPVIFHNYFIQYTEERPELGEPSNRDDDKYNYCISRFSAEQFISSGFETEWKCPRTTFHQIVTEIPLSLAFDVEMKYPSSPMYLNRVDFIERNEAIDITFEEIFLYANDRRLFFSSFDPMMCVFLAQKQQKWPVYQIVRKDESEDIRFFEIKMRGLSKIHKNTGVKGFVLDSNSVLKSLPNIVKDLVDMGYTVSTYGSPNNINEECRKQLEMGVTGLCTDKAPIVRKVIDEFCQK